MQRVLAPANLTYDVLRAALLGVPPGGEIWREAMIGPPRRKAICPIRNRIVGSWRPMDRRLFALVLFGMAVSLGLSLMLAVHHATWMYYVELIIALCT